MGGIYDYLPGLNFSAPAEWDPLKFHNIANVEGKLTIPEVLPRYFPMMATKGGPGFVVEGYYYICNNRGRKTKARQ